MINLNRDTHERFRDCLLKAGSTSPDFSVLMQITQSLLAEGSVIKSTYDGSLHQLPTIRYHMQRKEYRVVYHPYSTTSINTQVWTVIVIILSSIDNEQLVLEEYNSYSDFGSLVANNPELFGFWQMVD